MNPAFGGVPWKPAGEACFFGAAGQDDRIALLVEDGGQGVGGEVKGHLWRTHFVVGSLEVEFGFEFRHGAGHGVALIKPSPSH